MNKNDESFTPNHFLRGASNNVDSPGIFSNDDMFDPKLWRKVQVLQDRFWTRGIREYLPNPTRRTK